MEYNEVIKQFLDGKGLFYSRVKISDNIEMEEGTGYLFCKNSILGHVGVQKYKGTEVGLEDENIVDVVREAIDVFDEDSLASFDGKPITLYHPEEKVTSKNFQKYAVGHVKNVHRDGDNIVGDLVIQDADAIELVVDGKLKDLSLGYQADLVPTADGRLKQEKIIINHLAIVEEGRAINARIVDSNTIEVGDTIHKSESTTITKRVSEYDDETGEEHTDVETHEHYQHTHYEKLKQLYDEEKQKQLNDKKNEGETGMEKDFKYYLSELKELRKEPKSEFRDAMYQALNKECLDALKVGLPPLEEAKQTEVKDSVVEGSVGFKDTKVEEETKPKTIFTDAKAEEKWFESLYRRIGKDKEFARKVGAMDYHDVIEMIETGGSL